MRAENEDLELGEREVRQDLTSGEAVFAEVEAGWAEGELLEERASAIRRSGQRLARLLKELKGIEAELDRLDLTLQLPGLTARLRRSLQAEMDMSVDAYNHLREAAAFSYRQLISQRESCGFRGHQLIRRCYPIPDLLLPPDTMEEIIEA